MIFFIKRGKKFMIIIRNIARTAIMLTLTISLVTKANAETRNKPYTVSTTEMGILAAEQPVAIGTNQNIKENDVIFKAPLVWLISAKLENDVAIKIADLEWKVSKESLLQFSFDHFGGDISILSPKSNIFCDDWRRDQAKVLANSLTLGLSQLGARIAKDTRLCLVDEDLNNEFEKAFLVGLKKPEDRFMIKIDGVKYQAEENRRISDADYVYVKFYDGGILNGPGFEISIIKNGIPVQISSLKMIGPEGLNAAPVLVRATQNIKLKKLPFKITFGKAAITVTEFDAVSKIAKIQYDSDWEWSPIGIIYPTQYIYIYY